MVAITVLAMLLLIHLVLKTQRDLVPTVPDVSYIKKIK